MVMREVCALGSTSATVQAFDIVAATGEQAHDPRQHAGLVVHEHGDGVTFDVGSCHLRFSHILWNSSCGSSFGSNSG